MWVEMPEYMPEAWIERRGFEQRFDGFAARG
jgi:hypothetical protein